MITENLSTLKIHKLTQAQYDRELAAGRIDENAIYLTPDKPLSWDEIQDKPGNLIYSEDLTSHTDDKNNPHEVAADQIGAVPVARTINGKALSEDITLSASDVGTYSKEEVDNNIAAAIGNTIATSY